jgi:hypothetical protein
MSLKDLSIDELYERHDALEKQHQAAVARFIELKRQADEAEREMTRAETAMDTVGRQIERRQRDAWRAKMEVVS